MPPGGENERALSIRLLITWPSRESWPGTTKASGPPPSKVTRDLRAVGLADLVVHRDHGVEQLCEIDRRPFVALQFGIEAAGVGDVGDQPVEPFHVVLDDREQPLSGSPSILASGIVSTAERSEVSGFFSSCATSAAKLSIASIRL